ncbi:unnamed protein product [Pedinophyceae sp. YPF-701]|nr:unnamed protein product [Pedinophyceae sp. YPF-701]
MPGDGVRAAKAVKDKRLRPLRLKVVFVGPFKSGKTSVIRRYCQGAFTDRHLETIGIDFGVRQLKIGNFDVHINIFDAGGLNEYRDVRTEFYGDANGAVLVYDVSDLKSLDRCDWWMAEMERHGMHDAAILVAGNKTDEDPRVVSEAQGRSFAARHGCAHFDVSAKSGAGVGELMATLVARMISAVPEVPDELVLAAEKALEEY